MMPKSKLKVLLLAYEVAPFIKVGGLGDVAGSLPLALSKLSVDCRVILPLYKAISRKKFKLKKKISGVRVPTGRGEHRIDIWEAPFPGTRIPVYFIDYKPFFGRNEVFGYKDDKQRFLFFGKAVTEAMKALSFQADVLHCNDWHSGMVPVDINKEEKEDPEFCDVASVYTIHNLAYRKSLSMDVLDYAGLIISDSDHLAEDMKDDGKIDTAYQGIANADMVSTVSPTYAKEILTKEYGAGLQEVLKKRKSRLVGILNGIDYASFDPMKDKNLKHNFNTKTLKKGKDKNKKALQKELGLPEADVPVLGIVTRLVWQKGVDIFVQALGSILKNNDVQVVVLGTGEKKLEAAITKFAKQYPEKVSANIMFDVGLAERIYASSDFFLMPSRYEPCGLGQMIAMRFGTVVIARATGGLTDTVPDASHGGVGFVFKPYNAKAFGATVKRALQYYKRGADFDKLRARAMKQDFTWDRSAKEYVKLYKLAQKHNKAKKGGICA
ncbi:glycogen synthase [Patescibacteria group bacterium]